LVLIGQEHVTTGGVLLLLSVVPALAGILQESGLEV